VFGTVSSCSYIRGEGGMQILLHVSNTDHNLNLNVAVVCFCDLKTSMLSNLETAMF
jgi:hypothetical protein